jgi:hypothetical protein
MTDRSRIIRHPDVVMGEFQRITGDLASLRHRIAEAEQELEQVSEIAYEMMRAWRAIARRCVCHLPEFTEDDRRQDG